jgi:predicted O-linked N-acetylglucosamine transferase (SPINDLY family)
LYRLCSSMGWVMNPSKEMQVKQKISLLAQQKQFSEAIKLAQMLVQGNPADTEAWFVLAQLSVQVGAFREAALSYLRACQRPSPFALQALERAVHISIDHSFFDLGREPAKALAEAKADSADAQISYGLCCFFMNHFLEAIEAFDKALKIEPNNIEALNRCGMSYGYIANNEKAQTYFQKSLSASCKGNRASRLLVCSNNYLENIDEMAVSQSHRDAAAELEAQIDSVASLKLDHAAIASRKLRIGICSEDFRIHSVAYFLMPIFKHYDANKWEIFCYSDVPKADAVTEDIKGRVDHFIPCNGLTDEQMYQQIRADEIDVLIDLMGYFGQSRFKVFAKRAAPVQMTYLGYPNTTGLSEMDYRLVDKHTDKGDDEYYSESLIRLDDSFICFEPDARAPELAPLPMQTAGFVTFGAFNSIQKLTELNVRMWSKVLCELPTSRLLLKSVPLNEAALVESMLERFGAYGVSRERIDVVGITPTREEHLGLYAKVDIHFDTYPYNGTTTTCEALWQGVPTLTLAGERHRSRVGLSILHQVGLAEWVTFSEQEFVERAISKAGELGELIQVREGLRERMRESPLMDGPGFVSALESALATVLENE